MVTTDPVTANANLETLLDQARAGSAEAFCAVGEALEGRLFRQAVALCRSEDLAEDLVAETLVEAWRSLARYDGSCRFTTWLYAILLHRFQKAVRSARCRPTSASAIPASAESESLGLPPSTDASPPGPDEVMDRRENEVRWRTAIAALPEAHQQVILLRFYEDASLAEIAAALGIALGTVKSRLHHALEKLRREPSVLNLLRESRES
ncbi:MAG: RNA polymerase sigma factor [Verrucomicrobiales bacterium]|nr:RNA polymerase sigma factor [Verrucomicrobiales bacterium]